MHAHPTTVQLANIRPTSYRQLTTLDHLKPTALGQRQMSAVLQSLFVCCLTSQQQAIVYLRDGSAQTMCCHTEVEAADQTFYLTQSQYTDTGPTSPHADLIMPGVWQGSHWSANVKVTCMTRPGKIPSLVDSNARSSALEADALTTRPTGWSEPPALGQPQMSAALQRKRNKAILGCNDDSGDGDD